MRKYLLLAAALLSGFFIASSAQAQSFTGQIAPGTVYGNSSASPAKPQSTKVSNGMLTQMPAGTVKCNATNATANAQDCKTIHATPEQFGAVGDGVTDDTVAFNNLCNYIVTASNGASEIDFNPGHTYMIWKASSGTPATNVLCNLSGAVGLHINFNGAGFTTDNTFTGGTAGYLYVFYFNGGSDLRIDGLQYTQTVKTTLDDQNGGVVLQVTGDAHRVVLTNWNINNAALGLWATTATSWPTATLIASDIQLLGANFTGVYYPMNFNAAGDRFFARGINCNYVGRCYFPWNVHDQDVEIQSNHGGPFNDVLLKVYCDAAATAERNSLSNIRVFYRNKGRQNATSSDSLTAIEMQQDTSTPCTGAQIRNIYLTYDADRDSNGQPAGIKTYKFAYNTAIDNTVRNYVIDNVVVSGKFQNWNDGNAVADLFNTANGDYTGETIRNIVFRDFRAEGSSTSLNVNAVAITNGLVFENVSSNFNFNITNTTATVCRLLNVQTATLQDLPLPTIYTSGTGTYQTPICAISLDVDAVGGGGGGGGSGTSPGAANGGGNTTFGSFTAGAGGAGTGAYPSFGAGGAVSGCDDNIIGGDGGPAFAASSTAGGSGGVSTLGGNGALTNGQAGPAAKTNSGSGGGGAGAATSMQVGGGGGAGATCRKLITSPFATYSYAVGGGGAGGTAGTGGLAGGNGAAGRIKVVARFH